MSKKAKNKKEAPKQRTAKNMIEFIKSQQQKHTPLDAQILEALREMIRDRFEGGDDLPTARDLCEKLERPYDSINGALARMSERRSVVNVSSDPRNKRWVPNEPEFLGDNVV